jgi:two-component system, OmpR family, response regulator
VPYRLLALGLDPGFSELLQDCARERGLILESAVGESQTAAAVRERKPDLVFADLEGLNWLKALPAGKALAVVVAADRATDAQVAEALDWGAEDVVRGRASAGRVRELFKLRFDRDERLGFVMTEGDVAVDSSRRECRVRGKAIALKPREFELLEILVRKAGRVLSRTYLLEAIWGMPADAGSRAVDVGVSRLRKALGSRAGRQVETVERFGYRFKLGEP